MQHLQVCLFLLFVLSLPVPAYSQATLEKSVARKFDEFTVPFNDPYEEDARLLRFAKQLKREPSAKGYLIAYTPRILDFVGSSYWYIAENRCLTTKAQLDQFGGIPESRVICVDGGVREYATVELWILPVQGKPPSPAPEFAAEQIVKCYPLRVSGETYARSRKSPLKFSAAFTLNRPGSPFEYFWSVKNGEIVDGQGTDSITVQPNDGTETNVSARVELKGFSAECNETASSTTVVGVSPYRLSNFEENYSEALDINLDLLTDILQKHPHLHGYILVYGGRITGRGAAEKKGGRARYYLNEIRGVPESRFSIANGGYREKPMFEIWVVEEGFKPKPSATVDARYVRFTDRRTAHK
ncbi:MAG TPA: hypothetical protein VF290_06040 [Pyrinomonadaceae bacterium]